MLGQVEPLLTRNDGGQPIIVIGASTGGFEAIRILLRGLPADFSGIIVVCQHVDKSARLDYRRIFPDIAYFRLVEVEDKEIWVPGTIYFAPPGYHLYLEESGCFALSVDPPVNWSRPSIDVLFESAARSYRTRVTAVILTGANGDGAQGIMEVKRLGGTTIAQNPDTALASVMPRMSIETGCVDHVLDISEIAPFLDQHLIREQSSHKGAS